MLEHKLEEIKKMGAYAVEVFYGEGIGCDDGDISADNRKTMIMWVPVGCVGECKILWHGKLKEVSEFDFKKQPTQIPNPPGDEWKEPGYYIWGTEQGVKIILEKFKEN